MHRDVQKVSHQSPEVLQPLLKDLCQSSLTRNIHLNWTTSLQDKPKTYIYPDQNYTASDYMWKDVQYHCAGTIGPKLWDCKTTNSSKYPVFLYSQLSTIKKSQDYKILAECTILLTLK